MKKKRSQKRDLERERENAEFEAIWADLEKAIENSKPEDMPYYKMLLEIYPDIPVEYVAKWNSFDEQLKNNTELIDFIKKTATALERASKRCQYLLTKQEPTSPRTYKGTCNILAEASHKAEDLIAQLKVNLPMPVSFENVEADVSRTSDDHTAEIITCSPEHIIIWMPRLPRHNRVYSSLALRELSLLLSRSKLPTFPQWHCDFIHVFSDIDNLDSALDVDNYPYKPIIDILARSLRTDDGAFNFSCGMYNMTSSALKTGCYLHIIKREQKVLFFEDFENHLM